MTASVQPLPGNLLTPADSDFETWSGNWAAGSNTAVAQSAAQAFTGSNSMRLTATASGSVSATSGYLPAIPSAGYIASGYAYATAASRTGTLSVTFYNSSHTSLGTVTGGSVALSNGSWIPVVMAAASPAATAYVKLTITVATPGASEAAYFDMAYCALAAAQFLAAWYSLPSATTPVWADITPFVRADKGVTVTRGRADEISDVQAGRLALTADNTSGWFSQGNAASPWSPVLGRRVQVNRPDETGAWHTRADMRFTDLPVSWDGSPAKQSLVACAASGILAGIGRLPALRTMLEQEILYDAPLAFYTLGDASGSTSASDSSGNGAAPLVMRTYGSGGALAFASGAPLVECGSVGSIAGTSSPLPSVLCTPHNTGSAASACSDVQLEGFLPSPVTASAGLSFEVWTTGVPFANNTGGYTWWLMSIGNPRTGAMIGIRLTGGNSSATPFIQLCYTANMYATSPTFTSVTLSDPPFGGFPEPLPGMLFVTVSGTTATLYFNGVSGGSITVPSAFAATYVTVGGPLGGNQGWQGSLNCAAVYPSAVSSGRLPVHYAAGSTCFDSEAIPPLIGNVARYAGVPSWAQSIPSDFSSRADLYSLSGQGPLAAMQTYEQVDGGVLFENAAGQVAYQDRTTRYAAQASTATVLVLTAGQYEPDYTPVVTDQFLLNDADVSTPRIPGGARAVNVASVAAYGTYPSGTPASPTSGPYYSWPNSGVQAAGSPDVIGDAASWTVGVYGQPGPRSPKVTIDMLTAPGDGLSKAAVYAAEIGTLLELQGLPSQQPGGVRNNYMMIEGVTEAFSISDQGAEDVITFNTSPSMQSGAWIAGDSAMGVLDSTAVVGRGTDGNSGGYVGPPYTVPTFSTSMNITGNVGANDMRGLAYNVQQQVTPPCAFACQLSAAQSIPNATNTDVVWDTLLFDTAIGFTLQSATIYTVPVAGQWLLMASVVFAQNATGDRYAWYQQNGTTISQSVQGNAGGSVAAGVFTSAIITAAVGDQLKVTCFQTSGGSLALSGANGGPTFTLLYLGT